MSRNGKAWMVLLFASLVFLAPMQSADAAFLYNWGSGQMFTDPVGDAIHSTNTGRDIIAAYHAYDSANDFTYFRIDLVSPPVEAYNWGTKFGIYIDSQPNFGAPASAYEVPQIPGIDGRIDSTLYVWPNQWIGKYKYWTGTQFSSSVEVADFQHSENGGATLEWKYEGNFGPAYTWYAASLYEGYSDSVKCTFDYVATPIPSSVWLLGTGLVGLIALRRRSRGRS